MKKPQKMNEIAWICGTMFCALGVALCTKANFGLSMIAAPAYIIHIFMENFFEWYSQGTSEYIWQGILLIVMCIIVRRFKPKYLLTFGCAMIFGFAVDGFLWLLGGSGTYESMAVRIIAFIIGETITAVAIACNFRTSLPLPVYELVVTEIAKRYNIEVGKVKQINDIVMFAVSIILAFALNQSIQGIGIGTIVITIVNAPLIAGFGKLLDKCCDFSPRFPKFVDKIKV
ncbi:MAG: hypothetical protein IJA60_04160 [Clostridia bacterium]|nr:hypothetical protein [Clostridia bacterium]